MNALFAAAALCTAVFCSAPVDAADRRVTVLNATRTDIMELYGSYRDTDDWQEDVLGRDVLGAGERVRINFNDGTGYCIFDFKAVFEDGTEVTKFGVNVCEVVTFTFFE